MYVTTTRETRTTSVLGSLRALVPARRLSFAESLRIAELQANRLLELHDVAEGPVPSEVVSDLPRLRVVREYDMPVSGSSHWTGTHWLISLNAAESWARRRHTLMHEFKHVVDHGAADRLYPGSRTRSPGEQAEQVAYNYFAGCVLMPKRLLKRAFGEGLRRPPELARYFAVSEAAASVRLAQLGLVEPRARCQTPNLCTSPRRAPLSGVA